MRKTAVFAAFVGLVAFGASAQDDPPARVARLNYMSGNVSMEPAGADDWVPATINRPFTTGDYLYTDQGSQAELHMDVAVMRMGQQTSFGFLNVNDGTVQIKLSEGDMYIRVRNFGQGQVFEVDTPNAAVTLLSNGVYRFRVDPNGNMSYIAIRNGQAEITGGGQAFNLGYGQSATLTGTDELSYDVETVPAPDQFDEWCVQRDNHEARLVTARYLPPTVIGYEDLDDYGGWQQAPTYGAVWYPRQVEVGWAPYHRGHWAWMEPWGYTWVDDSPWGFAPFHYGRWAYVGSRWGWCPGPMAVGVGVSVGVNVGVGYGGGYVRPYYAPALVAFFGGSGFSASISVGFGGGFGGGVSMGWVPLGFGEVYSPPYQVSQNYFRNVNVSNTTINKTVNITNVYNTTYVNKTVNVTNVTYANMRAPNAVMAMPQSAFASGRPVAEVARPVPAAQVARIQVASAAVVAPPVAPTREALMPTAGSRPAPRPAAQVMQRQVVAKNTPPPPPASFAAKQTYLQQHAGQPLNTAALHQAVAPARPAAATVVRQAPPARPVQVHPGQVVGNAAALRAVAPRPAANAAPATRPTPAPAPAARPTPAAAPTNRPTPAPAPAARPTPAPAPAARPTPAPAPAARPTPAPAPANRPTPAPAPAARPTPAPAARPAPTEPAARPTPAPATHGTPPNTRPAPAQPAARPAERPAPAQPAARPAERPAPEPAARPAERPAAPQPERPAPAPRREPEARPTTPPARTESKPTKPEHGTPPAPRSESKETKDTKDHSK
ncbi:MAG: hypothetical protein JOZ48_10050 [Acidobacteriaceae bacterium]|nr:hypothetical protein [Acidobacteriaceae bacterium]